MRFARARQFPQRITTGVVSTWQRFVQTETSSGVMLMAMAVVALAWANSPYASTYHGLWHQELRLQFGGFHLEKSLAHWINDGLMVLFFLYVGLEIKRELVVGELSTPKRALLPAAMAVGGMVVPALIFAAINPAQPELRGWGVPMATDIAFALGVLLLAGSRVPAALKMALLALAIVDDLGAVLVIALFYTADLQTTHLLNAGVILVILAVFNAVGVKRLFPYLAMGFLLWLEVLQSGVHVTVAGVLLAFAIPVRSKVQSSVFEEQIRTGLKSFNDACRRDDAVLLTDGQQSALHYIHTATVNVISPLQRVEHSLKDFVAFGIMPVFALANAGVTLSGSLGEALGSPVTLGVVAGLVLGKPIGIVLITWLVLRLGWAEMPKGATWAQLLAIGCLGGIGFTMSLFVADLAYSGQAPHLLDPAKVGILAGTLLSGFIGYILMRRATAHTTE